MNLVIFWRKSSLSLAWLITILKVTKGSWNDLQSLDLPVYFVDRPLL